MDFIRELGHAEYFYYMYNKLASTNFVVAVELRQAIRKGALSDSVNSLFKEYEVFHSKIETKSATRLAFCRGSFQHIGLSEQAGKKSALNPCIAKEVSTPMEIESCPLRLTIFTEVDSKTQFLLFTFNHLFNDASSALVLVQKTLALTLSETGSITLQKQSFSPNQEQLYPCSVHGLSFLKAIVSMIKRDRSVKKKYGRMEQRISKKYSDQSRNIDLMRTSLNKMRTRNLLAIARKNGLTVHHLLCAIQLMVVRRHYHSSGVVPLSMSMPVNLRGMLHPVVDPETPGLYISIPKLSIPVGVHPNLMELASVVKSELERKISSKEVFILWSLLPRSRIPNSEEGLCSMNALFSKNPESTMISNLGAVPVLPVLESWNPIHSLHFAVAPPKDAMFCSAVCSFNGEMVLSICFNTDLLSKDVYKCMFQNFKKELLEITS